MAPHCLLRGNLQARLAETIDQLLDKLRIPPLPELLACHHGEIWSQRKQIPYSVARRLPFAELPVGHRECEACTPEAGHVDFEGDVQRAAVVALAVRVEEGGEPIPSGMMGVEAPGLLHQSAAAFPVAGIGDQKTHV